MDTSIKIIKISKLEDDKFLKPFRIDFEQNGVRRHWDCVNVHDSVAALLYHRQKDSILLVKQFRAPVWYYQTKHNTNQEMELGFTYELCAGIMDKGISREKTIKEEILEETGYLVEEVEYVTSCFNGLGFSANQQTMFYATIDESMKKGLGGGVDGEDIELFFLPLKEAKSFIFDERLVKAPGLLYMIMWFLENKKELYKKSI